MTKRRTCVNITQSSRDADTYGRVVELVDSLDSGSSVHCGRAGSSPASPTKEGHPKGCPSFLLEFRNNREEGGQKTTMY